MLKILIPVDGSRNCEFVVKHVIKQFMNNTAMEMHLLNVQPPFSGYVARFVSRKSLHDFHRDEAEKALGPVKQMLDGYGIPYAAHFEVGKRAEAITDTTRRLDRGRRSVEVPALRHSGRAGRSAGRRRLIRYSQELQDSAEQPALWRAHSGRRAARSWCAGCSS